jgi:hypothetical protein
MRSFLICGCTAIALVSLMGCEVAVDDPNDDYYEERPSSARSSAGSVRGGEGALSVEWTIAGTTDPRACFDYEVDHAYVTIEDDRGLVDEADVDCEAFGYDAPPLPAGVYWATIVLRDSSGLDLTEVAETDERDLPPGSSDYVSINFGDSSFR